MIDSGLTVIFRTQSDIEANVVEALLDSHGVETLRTAGPDAGLVPVLAQPARRDADLGARRATRPRRVRIIDSHREQVGGGIVVTLPQAFDALEARLGYRFRDRGLLEHALTHKSKAHEDPSGGVTDNESLEFLGDAVLGLVVSDALFRAFPTYSEGQKSKIKANLVSTASLAEMAELMGLGDHMILGPRRREDRRPPQAGAAGRHLRGADRRDLPRRRARAGAAVPDARAGDATSRTRGSPSTSAATTSRGCRNGCRAWAGRCRRIASPASSAPTTASCSTSKWWSATTCWRRAPAAPRRKPSRKGRGWRSRKSRRTANE